MRKSSLQAIAGCQVTMSPVTKSSFLVRSYCQCRSNLRSWSRLSRILPWCLSGSRIGWNDLQGAIILGWCGIFWFPIYNRRLDLSCQGMKNKFRCKFLVVFFSLPPDNFPQRLWAICWSFAKGQALKDEVSGDGRQVIKDGRTFQGNLFERERRSALPWCMVCFNKHGRVHGSLTVIGTGILSLLWVWSGERASLGQTSSTTVSAISGMLLL